MPCPPSPVFHLEMSPRVESVGTLYLTVATWTGQQAAINQTFFFVGTCFSSTHSTVWIWVSSVVQQDLWVTTDVVAVQRLSSSPWTCQRKQSTIIFVVCAKDDHCLQSTVALVEDPDLLPVQFGPPKVEPTCVAATYAVALCSFFASVTLPLHTSLL